MEVHYAAKLLPHGIARRPLRDVLATAELAAKQFSGKIE
jgi:hypothetical protein